MAHLLLSAAILLASSFLGTACTAASADPSASASASAVSGREHFVSPSGSLDGDGTAASPWSDLQAALDHPASIHPGDTIWVRGGRYGAPFTSKLVGTADAPIVVRAYPGERAILDAGASNDAVLLVAGSHTWFWGLEITSSSSDRVSEEPGSSPSDMTRGDGVAIAQDTGHGVGTRLINLVIHDTRQGIGFWTEAEDSEVHGCLIYYNGWMAPDRAHGHGIYVQNAAGTKRITGNLIFSGFAYGIHAFGTEARVDNLTIEDNILFGNGITSHGREPNFLLGSGSAPARSLLFRRNLLYHRLPGGPSGGFWIGYDGCTDASVTENYAAGNDIVENCASGLTLSGNTFYYHSFSGISEAQYPENTFTTARPSGVRVFVRPNAYEPGRANIAVYNWDLASTTRVDLSSVLPVGTAYEIKNAQDFFGPPVLSGVYAGGEITLPTGALPVAAAVGAPAPAPTGPEFNAFVLLPTGYSRTPPQPVERPSAPAPRSGGAGRS